MFNASANNVDRISAREHQAKMERERKGKGGGEERTDFEGVPVLPTIAAAQSKKRLRTLSTSAYRERFMLNAIGYSRAS